jgi:hypothetical protein
MRPDTALGRSGVIANPGMGNAMPNEPEETPADLLHRVDEAVAESEKLAADTEALLRRVDAQPLSKPIASDESKA